MSFFYECFLYNVFNISDLINITNTQDIILTMESGYDVIGFNIYFNESYISKNIDVLIQLTSLQEILMMGLHNIQVI